MDGGQRAVVWVTPRPPLGRRGGLPGATPHLGRSAQPTARRRAVGAAAPRAAARGVCSEDAHRPAKRGRRCHLSKTGCDSTSPPEGKCGVGLLHVVHVPACSSPSFLHAILFLVLRDGGEHGGKPRRAGREATPEKGAADSGVLRAGGQNFTFWGGGEGKRR